MEGHLCHVYSHVCTLNHLYAGNMTVSSRVLFSRLLSRHQRRLQIQLRLPAPVVVHFGRYLCVSVNWFWWFGASLSV